MHIGIVVLVASLTSFEFFHELYGHHAQDALICSDPATQKSPLADLVLMHVHSHR